MTDEVDDYLIQIDSLIDEINKLNQNGKENLDKVRDRRKRIDELIKSVQIEIKELSVIDQPEYRIKLHETTKRLKEIDEDINSFKITVAIQHNTDNMTTGQIISAAKQVQKDSLNSLANSKNIVSTTIEIGTGTIEELSRQREQLERINKRVDIVDSNLNKATKQLRVLMRRMATDKLIATFICLIVLGIIAIIIIGVLKKYGVIISGPGIPGLNTTNTTTMLHL